MKTLERLLLHAVSESSWRAIKGLEDRTWNGIQPWAEAPVVQTLQSALLERLQYPERLDREARIPEAFNRTFDWIFSDREACETAERPWSSFRHWLESGDSVYWITGKPGSGKSTLMKMLYHEPRTAEYLRTWVGPCGDLIIAGFYFWHAGTELQTSHEGLFRSLLHQALSKRLAMSADSAVPSKWSAFSLAVLGVRESPLSWEQLVQGLRLLVEEEPESLVKYAFFIDGLDEYVGDSTRLISLLRNLSSYPNVKVCVSSRPWVVFEDEFRQAANLMLQHRTHNDIALYAEQNLTTNTAFRELPRNLFTISPTKPLEFSSGLYSSCGPSLKVSSRETGRRNCRTGSTGCRRSWTNCLQRCCMDSRGATFEMRLTCSAWSKLQSGSPLFSPCRLLIMTMLTGH